MSIVQHGVMQYRVEQVGKKPSEFVRSYEEAVILMHRIMLRDLMMG